MLLTPLLIVAADRWWTPRRAPSGAAPARTMGEIDEPQQAPIIIAGFGRYGQIVGRLLHANGFSATVLEHDAEQVESLRRFGWPVFYGDATRLDLLRTAGAAAARVIVVAIDDVTQSLAVAALAREHFPQATVVARARNVTHYHQLRRLGVTLVERETFDSALMSGRSVLEQLGFEPHQARTLALRFRRHNVELVEAMLPHVGDQARFIAMARQGRQELEELFAKEREEARQRRKRPLWGGDAAPPAPPSDPTP